MKRNLFILLSALIVFSCNNAKQDVLPTIDFAFETGPNLPYIISPAQLTGDYSTDVDFNVSPERGKVERITNANFLRYTPNPDFVGGTDFFATRITDSKGRQFGAGISVNVTDNECNYGPIFESIQVRKGETVVIDLLANDVFCSPTKVQSGGISIHELYSDFEEGSDIAHMHLNGPDDEVTLTITAPNTTGVLKFVYEIGLDIAIGESGLIPEANVLNPSAYGTYMIAEATIEVID